MVSKGKPKPKPDPSKWRERAEKYMDLVAEYEHTACGEVTGMSEDFVEKAVYDPYYFTPGHTYCCGCGDFVPDDECILANGKTVRAVSNRLRKETPMSFKLVRFLVIPGLSGLLAFVGLMLVAEAFAFAVLAAVVGAFLGHYLVARLVMTPLRRAGMLWR